MLKLSDKLWIVKEVINKEAANAENNARSWVLKNIEMILQLLLKNKMERTFSGEMIVL